jgi:hypothetical protein
MALVDVNLVYLVGFPKICKVARFQDQSCI